MRILTGTDGVHNQTSMPFPRWRDTQLLPARRAPLEWNGADRLLAEEQFPFLPQFRCCCLLAWSCSRSLARSLACVWGRRPRSDSCPAHDYAVVGWLALFVSSMMQYMQCTLPCLGPGEMKGSKGSECPLASLTNRAHILYVLSLLTTNEAR